MPGRCNTPSCTKYAVYGQPGGRPIRCKAHLADGMVDVKNPVCNHPSCDRRPSYNYEGQKAAYCHKHRQDGMVNTVSKRCAAPGCCKQPMAAKAGAARSRFCRAHDAAASGAAADGRPGSAPPLVSGAASTDADSAHACSEGAPRLQGCEVAARSGKQRGLSGASAASSPGERKRPLASDSAWYAQQARGRRAAALGDDARRRAASEASAPVVASPGAQPQVVPRTDSMDTGMSAYDTLLPPQQQWYSHQAAAAAAAQHQQVHWLTAQASSQSPALHPWHAQAQQQQPTAPFDNDLDNEAFRRAAANAFVGGGGTGGSAGATAADTHESHLEALYGPAATLAASMPAPHMSEWGMAPPAGASPSAAAQSGDGEEQQQQLAAWHDQHQAQLAHAGLAQAQQQQRASCGGAVGLPSAYFPFALQIQHQGAGAASGNQQGAGSAYGLSAGSLYDSIEIGGAGGYTHLVQVQPSYASDAAAAADAAQHAPFGAADAAVAAAGTAPQQSCAAASGLEAALYSEAAVPAPAACDALSLALGPAHGAAAAGCGAGAGDDSSASSAGI